MTQGKQIRLINPGGMYSHVVARSAVAIARHLDEFQWGNVGSEGSFNVHFFREQKDAVTKEERVGRDFYISHGWFQKFVGKWPVQLNAFSHIGVPGPMLRDFLLSQGHAAEKLHVIGHPGMDDTISGRINPDVVSEKPIVVLALSHSSYLGSWTSIADKVGQRIRLIAEVIDTPHPARGFRLARDILQVASVCVSDWSGTIFEAWSLGVPVVFPTWARNNRPAWKWPGSPIARIYDEGVGYHCEAANEFPKMIERAIHEGITKAETQFIDDYFPIELRGQSGKAAAGEIEKAAGG